jgi:broad specificity phosphatase PhoE
VWTSLEQGRYLHFVRHGHYRSDEMDEGKLTALGRKQARRAARHFAGLGIDSIASSDWIRAVETADILANELGLTTRRRYRVLREMLPTRLPMLAVPQARRKEGAQRIERIIQRFFRQCRGQRHEIMVSHGNLIRALVLRVSAGRAEGWYRLTADHASVTTFLVGERGIEVVGVNALGHLPAQLRTNF